VANLAGPKEQKQLQLLALPTAVLLPANSGTSICQPMLHRPAQTSAAAAAADVDVQSFATDM
jgi:hypothetical protein